MELQRLVRGGIAKDEDAEMICVTDMRLDVLGGLRGKTNVCRTLKRATEKTWAGEYITRKEDKRIGGTYIFHTIDWTNFEITSGIKYGVLTEINGTWNRKKYRLVSVYRPCYGSTEGSLRVTMDLEYKMKFEEEFWNKLNEVSLETCIIGGDFNMGKEQIDKRLIKEGMMVDRKEMPGNPSTFHRWDSTKLNLQTSTIDHILMTNGQRGGAKVSGTGLDLNDHSVKVGWMEAPRGTRRIKEMKGTKLATLRPADKGATKKFMKAWERIHDDKISNMNMEEIIEENRRIIEKISANRNTKRNPNGWSPISRLVSLRISVHGTARRMQGKLTYEAIMK